MGLTVLALEVGNPANPEITEKLEFLIDSGAIYSVVPTPILQRLGIKPLSEQAFRLADGSKITRKKKLLFLNIAIESVAPTPSLAKKVIAYSWALLLSKRSDWRSIRCGVS